MKEICGKNIESVVYQFSRPLGAMEMYNSIEEFNSVYEKVLTIVNRKTIKNLEKEFLRSQAKLLKKKDNVKFDLLKKGFVSMRLNALVDKQINVDTKYIDIQIGQNYNIYAMNKIDPRYSDDAWILEAQVKMKDNSNKIVKNLKRTLQLMLGRNYKKMLS